MDKHQIKNSRGRSSLLLPFLILILILIGVSKGVAAQPPPEMRCLV